jgi:hypothetical protein
VEELVEGKAQAEESKVAPPERQSVEGP